MTRDQLKALALATGCALERDGRVFLCDPHASENYRTPFETIAASAGSGPGWLCLATGGSSGGLKFARHDERTLGAAVAGFCTHFNLTTVHAVDVLPAYHVSGFMARVRCAATGGVHLPWDWKRLEGGEYPDWAKSFGGADATACLSLVPTQLQRLLAQPTAVDWLRQFTLIFLGGGPTWPSLADQAASVGLRIALSYGMTETAAMVTALRPNEFLAGERTCGASLPHARLRLTAEGVIAVGGESLMYGYVGDGSADARLAEFVSEDLGEMDARGHVRVLGRRDAVIISGGKKVQPLEVEAALRASGEFSDVAVLGVPDAEWGEVVVACYPRTTKIPDGARAAEALAAWQRPKRYVALDDWPRTAAGKVSREALRQLLGRVP